MDDEFEVLEPNAITVQHCCGCDRLFHFRADGLPPLR